jgi:radical SAM family uncharacterized protein
MSEHGVAEREALLSRLLPLVSSPGQYIGSEWNAVVKEHGSVAVRFAFCFPDTYRIGMSYLGLQVLYHVLNSQEDMLCERAFLPEPDMQALLRREGLPLFSLESTTPLSNFDVLGFSLQNETAYTNVLAMLDLAGLPLRAAERTREHPLVIAGGPCAYNPEPMAAFFDLFFVGDAEEDLPRLLRRFAQVRSLPRREQLRALAGVSPAVYVPAFYEPRYDNGAFRALEPVEAGARLPIEAATLADLEGAPYPTAPVMPYVEVVHDRMVLEVMRGCPHRCRFCQASVVKAPLRLRSPERLLALAEELYRNTGYSELSLLSLSTGDYPKLTELVQALAARFDQRLVNIALPSLRVDASLRNLPPALASVRKSGLTLAPEAAGESLRAILGKRITNDDLLAAARSAYEAGWDLIKLYFMVGLPGETDNDVASIGDLARSISVARRDVRGGDGLVNLTVAPFVPKAHSAFQWEPMRELSYFQRADGLLRRHLRSSRLRLKFHRAERAFLEAVFSRGDRRLAPVVEEAYRRGCRMDAWTEHFDFGAWQEAFRATGVDPEAYALRARTPEEPLPWEHIATGVPVEHLRKSKLEADRLQAERREPESTSPA